MLDTRDGQGLTEERKVKDEYLYTFNDAMWVNRWSFLDYCSSLFFSGGHRDDLESIEYFLDQCLLVPFPITVTFHAIY